MSYLDRLGKYYGTDKASDRHDYLEYYWELFPFFGEEITVLEIGVYEGASLKVWEEYFPKARVVGIDQNPECEKYATNRTKVFVGRQEDTRFLQKVIDQVGEPDIVIDDGGHVGTEQLETFKFLYPCTRQLYIVEDLHMVETTGYEFLDHALKFVRDWAPVGSKDLKAVEFRHNLCVFQKVVNPQKLERLTNW